MASQPLEQTHSTPNISDSETDESEEISSESSTDLEIEEAPTEVSQTEKTQTDESQTEKSQEDSVAPDIEKPKGNLSPKSIPSTSKESRAMFGIQCFIVTINSIISLLGLLLVIFGCFVLFIYDYVQKYIVTTIVESSGYVKTLKDGDIVHNLNLEKYLDKVAYIAICVGFILLVVALIGCVGTLTKSKMLLLIHAAVVLLLIVTAVALIVVLVAFPETITDVVKEYMQESLRNEYRGYRSFDTVSLAWNYMMISLQCCGVVNYNDFQSAKLWQRNITIHSHMVNVFKVQPEVTVNILLKTPVTCCKNSMLFKREEINSIVAIACATAPTELTSNMNEGCLQLLMGKIKEYYIYVDLNIGGFILLEVQILILVFKQLLIIRRHENFNELRGMFLEK